MNPWASVDDARAPGLWPDAGTIPDATLQTALDAGYEMATAYAPPVAGVPARYTQAVIRLARMLWEDYRNTGGVIGFENYAVTPKAMPPAVKQLLRPARGVPVVGL